MEKPVYVEVPSELMDVLGVRDVKSLERHFRLLLALDLYMSGKISLGKAAELAGISYDEFWDELRRRGLKLRVGPKTIEEAEREYEAVREHARK